MTRYCAFLLLAAAVGLQVPTLHGQQTQTPEVTFQVEVNYVDVDVVVTDDQGNFVTGLTRDDFEVFENGRPQKIDTFSQVGIPVEKSIDFVHEGRLVVADTQTNRRPFDGRVYVIVLDDLDVSAMRSTPLKDAARKFVREFMGANDLAAVVYTSGRKDTAQEFTSNRELLVAAIDKFIGQRMRSLSLERLDSYYQTIAFGYTSQTTPDPGTGSINQQDPAGYGRVSDPTELERGTRALTVLDTLKNTAEFLGSVRGRRKALLFFSEGLDYPIRDVFGALDATTVIRASQDAISMAARANVNFYAVDPRGLAGMTTDFMEGAGLASGAGTPGPILLVPGRNTPANGITGASGTFDVQDELRQEFRTSQDTLRELTEETGGFATLDTNNVAPAFERIVDANSRYYVLGYYPPTHPRDGRFYKIEVRVKRPNLRVEARKGYAAPRGRTPEERKRDEEARAARDARRPDGKRASTPLLTALLSPIPQSGLTFTVQAAPFKNTANEASIALAIELDGSRLPYTEPNAKGMVSNKIELSFFGLSAQGKAIAPAWTELDLTLRPETRDRVTAHGVRANPRISLAPGRYQIKIGARESVSGQAGSVFYDLEVPDFRKEKLMVGGLLMTTPSVQQTPSIQPDPNVSNKLLPAPATSRREFPRSDVLALYTEIYDNDSSRQARHIEVTVRLVSESGTNVIVSRDELENGAAGEKPWEIYGYAKRIPLKELAPGRYLLRVEAAVRGRNEPPATREAVVTVLQ
ncbi:MAG: VWA domain-containing protein [Vicinamibacterales bacterium]|nr:VWA domain-containing protein [Vicinamibacterales bacterium]